MVARVIDHPSYAGVLPTPYNPDPVLLAIVQTIRDGLLRDQHVRLQNFGTFRLRWSKERRIKHPKTGEFVIAAPAPKITFTPAKHLREWIEPNPKPVIPLHEPVNLQPNTKQVESQKITTSTTQEQVNEHELRETVEDIIDKEYNSRHIVTDGLNIIVDKENDRHSQKNSGDTINKKWGFGLIASVPLILLMLQADFSTENTNLPTNTIETEQSIQQSSPTAVISDNRIIRHEEVTKAPQETAQSNKSTLDSGAIATARPEPTPKQFHMTPQLHTIQQGDNLWNLAKAFYGDALLWPHIYRANKRTLVDPDVIKTGSQLVIPGLQQSPEILSTNDKELIAEGYFNVYQLNKTKNSPQAIYFLIGAKQYSYDWLERNRQDISSVDWKVISNRDD